MAILTQQRPDFALEELQFRALGPWVTVPRGNGFGGRKAMGQSKREQEGQRKLHGAGLSTSSGPEPARMGHESQKTPGLRQVGEVVSNVADTEAASDYDWHMAFI